MKNVIIAILVTFVLILGIVLITQKKKEVTFEPWPDTEPATVVPKTETPKPNTNSTTSPTETQTNNPIPTETEDNTQTPGQILIAYGVSVDVPIGLEGKAQTETSGANAGIEQVYVVNGNKRVVTIAKYPNQVRFDEDTATMSDYTLKNGNYAIGGIAGKYYQGKEEVIGDAILVSSKLIVIQIEPTSYSGVSTEVLTSILKSIKFD